MKKTDFVFSFWTLYTLGFTVVLPTGLYYAGEIEASPAESAAMAFIYLGLGVLIWMIVIGLYSRFFIQMVFIDKKRFEDTATKGITISAKITANRKVGTLQDTSVLNLRLAFTNLSGTAVEIPYQLNDARPDENRFEVGNTIAMRADAEEQIFVPENIAVSLNKGPVSLYAFILFLLLVAALVYPVVCYKLESEGAGWRFLSLFHPWIMVPLINMAVGGFIWCIGRFIKSASGSPEQPLRMILYGIKTTATILAYSQTGTYINEQPQVSFEIEYTDLQGTRHDTIYKKIISILDIHKINTGPKEIMYLPNEPQKIVFYEDLSL